MRLQPQRNSNALATSLAIVIVVVAVDRVLVIIFSDVLAVEWGVGRDGVVKQMLATQCA